MQPFAVLVAGVPAPFPGIAEAEFHELHAEDVAESERVGQSAGGVVLARTRHSEIHLAKKHDVGVHGPQHGCGGFEILGAFRIPESNPKGVPGRTERLGRRHDLDAMKKVEPPGRAVVGLRVRPERRKRRPARGAQGRAPGQGLLDEEGRHGFPTPPLTVFRGRDQPSRMAARAPGIRVSPPRSKSSTCSGLNPTRNLSPGT